MAFNSTIVHRQASLDNLLFSVHVDRVTRSILTRLLGVAAPDLEDTVTIHFGIRGTSLANDATWFYMVDNDCIKETSRDDLADYSCMVLRVLSGRAAKSYYVQMSLTSSILNRSVVRSESWQTDFTIERIPRDQRTGDPESVLANLDSVLSAYIRDEGSRKHVIDFVSLAPKANLLGSTLGFGLTNIVDLIDKGRPNLYRYSVDAQSFLGFTAGVSPELIPLGATWMSLTTNDNERYLAPETFYHTAPRYLYIKATGEIEVGK